ncbi:MAG: hypothetical protein ACOYMA_19905 [Bacteroidia bacterium]
MEYTIAERFKNNQKFQGKLSWKRKEAMNIKENIKCFVSDNFNIDLPAQAPKFKQMAAHGYNTESYTYLREEAQELIKLFYQFNYCGQSFASFFEDPGGSGKHETYTLAHTYSKHRFDPVWNMRKSNLIRSIYRNYLKETKVYKNYHPVHITLTLPHAGGLYEGKEFYAAELIEKFNLVRKKSFWKKMTYGGEYGVEIKESANKANGLHIHIHSLCFLKEKNVNRFRAALKKAWLTETGASQIWVETLYFHKKDSAGHYIKEIRNNAKLTTYEQEDGSYTSEGAAVKKKFYVDREAREIEKRQDLTPEEKENEILGFYLQAILETIKYHFKFEAVKTDKNNYNVFLMNEILKNTKKKRLYSRFGNFYKVEELNFNKISKPTASPEEGEPMAAAAETAINPFLMEAVPVENTQIVMFYPERQIRQPKTSPFAYELINFKDKKPYTFLDLGQGIKVILKNHFNTIYNKSSIQIEESRVKSKVNKGLKHNLRDPNDYLPTFAELSPDIFDHLNINYNQLNIN